MKVLQSNELTENLSTEKSIDTKNLDKETFDLIKKIADEHCHKVFAFLDENDLRQEIWVICVEAIKHYKNKRGHLEHFLRVTVKNRMINRFRSLTRSVRSPCSWCKFHDKTGESANDCALYEENWAECSKRHNYRLSIESRNSLLNSVEPIREEVAAGDAINVLAAKEIIDFIKDNLKDPEILGELELFLNREKMSKQREKKLLVQLKEFLHAAGKI